MARLSIIMPVLNEGEGIATELDGLIDLRTLGAELIVVDGGSQDATVQRARREGVRRRAAVPTCRHPVAGAGGTARARRTLALQAQLGPLRRQDRRPQPVAAAGRDD